ncbi:V-type ATP synthase subunit I [Planctomycetota bacterium]
MEKISLIVLDTHREDSLEKLREIGVLHLQSTTASSETLTGLKEDRTILENALRLLPEPEAPDEAAAADVWSAMQVASKAAGLAEKGQTLTEESNRLQREAAELAEWGDYDPADILTLREKGTDIRLYRLTRQQLGEIPEGVKTFVLKHAKSISNVALVLTGEQEEVPFDEIPLPERGLSEVERILAEKQSALEETKKELTDLAARKPAIESALRKMDGSIEFETAYAGMEVDEKLAFLTGYAPAARVDDLKKAAAAYGWAIVVEDPAEDDPVPTLIENPKWIRIIDPVFKVMGTVPGYREFDISMWFLVFFSVFFAMLIGDGGYGLVFLILTSVAHLLFRKKVLSEPFILMYVLSTCTVIWGALTGNWFGCEAISRVPLLNGIIVPSVYAFSKDSEEVVKYMCFLVAAIQLSLAHLLRALKTINSLKSLSQIGWSIVVWGMFLGLRELILEMPAPWFMIHMIGLGLGLAFVFASPSKNILKMISFQNVIDLFMSFIDVFKDSLSYIRLFAVGMATLAVAQSFNSLGAQIGFSKLYLIPASAFIIVGGHVLNIVLALMSVAVHGLRLNMLEFSGHIGMEWAGQQYSPFRKK